MIVLCKLHLANVMQRIPSEKEESEILWVKLTTSQVKFKLGLVYFPQETKTKTPVLREIYKDLEKEAKIGRENNETIMILGDFNCKIGGCIQGNSDIITKGGRELLRWTKTQNMIILNKTDKCSGIWTRQEGSSKSVLDYVLINSECYDQILQVEIDEDKEMAPYGICEDKKIYSDHNTIKVTINAKLHSDKGKTPKVMIMNKRGL